MKPALLFDLDGTLADTAPDICAAANATLTELNKQPVTLAEARGYIGDGMPRFIKRMLTRQWWGEPDAELFHTAAARMMEHYARECVTAPRLYDGVLATLKKFQEDGFPMACVTNKPARFTPPLLDACGLSIFFSAVVCGDTLPVKKPDAAPLLYACQTLGAPIKTAVMIGDSASDGQAAAAAGCRFIVVSYGYHRDTLPPADGRADSFADCLKAV